MPLTKSIAQDTGVSVTLWKVVDKYEHYHDQFVRVTLEGYIDGNAAKPLITGKVMAISGNAYSPDMTISQIESALKAAGELKDAV